MYPGEVYRGEGGVGTPRGWPTSPTVPYSPRIPTHLHAYLTGMLSCVNIKPRVNHLCDEFVHAFQVHVTFSWQLCQCK